ncbi:MAG: hypothetical protein KF886_19955 [Candidatus Hydrogenedentes bacterium]|nr:hypothetical protein [Candidatus Hydrogenedentota bacterium]
MNLRRSSLCLLALLIAGCASTPEGGSAPAPESASRQARIPEAPRTDRPERKPQGPTGDLAVHISDVSGRDLPSRVVLYRPTTTEVVTRFEVPTGRATVQAPLGAHDAYVYVYDNQVPILASLHKIEVVEGSAASISANLLEGASGKLTMRDFDQDRDLAIDRVELEAGSNPLDASSIPGHDPIIYDQRVLGGANSPGWFKGELHAVSQYGGGKETVAQLVQRAEQAGLDFLAITDLNTMEASRDPGFTSDRVVLIPALAWGSRDQGVALIYGPGTMPGEPEGEEMAQAECIRVQSQGGVFVVGHPCFTDAPWKWRIQYVNAVQVWNGPWRAQQPLRLTSLPETLKRRANGNLVYSIAAAAAVADKTAQLAANAGQKDRKVSANDQAALFWDYELVRGQVCSVVGGGMVDRPSVPMGQPTTWVYAANKSLPAIMEGLRLGRTFVGNRPDGVQLNFRADVLNDGSVDVSMGGAIPLGVDVGFYILVTGAMGAKVEMLRNGHAIMSEIIRENVYSRNFLQTTDFRAVYRLRVIRQPDNPDAGFGPVEVLAMSSPIYADDIGTDLLRTGPVDPSKTWVRIESKYTEEDRRIPY